MSTASQPHKPVNLTDTVDAYPQWIVETAKERALLKAVQFFGSTRNEFEMSVKTDTGATIWSLADLVVCINPKNKLAAERWRNFAKRQHENVRSIRLLTLPGLKKDETLYDFLSSKNGSAAADLLALLDGAEYFDPNPATPDQQPTDQPDQQPDQDQDTESVSDLPEPAWFPKADPRMFHGLAGEFIRLIEPHTESSNAGVLAQFLTFFGNVIGRSAHWQVEYDTHYTNLFTLVVGDSGSKKGSGLGRVKQCFAGIEDDWAKNCRLTNLSSGEGLLFKVRDAVYEERTDKKTKSTFTELVDQGVEDKRLLVIETEFATVFTVQGREGNNLSGYTRNFFDTGDAQSATKNSPLKATNAHVSIIGHITPDEFLKSIGANDATNGYLNRFSIVAVRRTKLLPYGSPVDPARLQELRMKLSNTIEFAKSIERMEFSKAARARWNFEYYRLELTYTGFLAGILKRASPITRRVACLYALLDRSDTVEVEHLEAALAFWKYCEDSAKWVFGIKTGDKGTDKLYEGLSNAGDKGLSRTEISQLFSGKKSKAEIDAMLKNLNNQGLADFTEDAKTASQVRSAQRWFAKFVRESALAGKTSCAPAPSESSFTDDTNFVNFANDAKNGEITNHTETNDLTDAESTNFVNFVNFGENPENFSAPPENPDADNSNPFWDFDLSQEFPDTG